MSGKLMGLCYKLRLKRSVRDVLQAYANFADDDGTNVWPSNETIAWMCDVTPRQVMRIKAQLYALDLLRVVENPQGGRYRVTVYEINVNILAGIERPELQKQKKNSEAIVSPLNQENGDKLDNFNRDTSTEKRVVIPGKSDLSDRKSDFCHAKNDAIASPDPPLLSANTNPSLNPSADTPELCLSNTNLCDNNSDSLRSSVASSRRSEDNDHSQQELQTKARVETCRRRFEQFRHKPNLLEMVIRAELGNDENARAEFFEWLASQQEGPPKIVSATSA